MALKCDLRESHGDDDEEGDEAGHRKEKETVDYKQGLEVARRIQALRYLGTPEYPLSLVYRILG